MISVLVVAFIYSSYSRAFAEPADPNWGEGGGCDVSPDFNVVTCCWTEPDLYNPGELVTWCQSCDFYGENCGPVQLDRSRTGPFAPPQGDGVLQQPPSEGEGGILPLTRSQSVLPQDSVLQEQQEQQQQPTDQGAAEPPATTEPATAEEELPVPVCQEDLEFNEDLGFCAPTECPERQILNEETGHCVLEEQEAVVEPEEQSEEAATTK